MSGINVCRADGEPLPHSRDLERTILGTAMADSTVLNIAIEQLRDDDFYYESHRDIFKIMKVMVQGRLPVDMITMNTRLESHNKSDLLPVLDEVSGSIGVAANLEGYIDEVKALGARRRLAIASHEIERLAYDHDTSFEEVVDTSEKLMQEAVAQQQKSNESNMTDIISRTMDHMQKIHQGSSFGITTGFPKLDEYLCGLEPAQTIIIAGRPSAGKTAFATAMMLQQAIVNKIPIAFFSLETGKVQLGQRILSQWSGINLMMLRKGIMTKDMARKIHENVNAIADAPIYIDDEPLLTINQFRSKIRKMKSKYGIKVAYIDYMQLMKFEERLDSNTGIGRISRGLKITAKDMDMPIVALSQLSRENEKRKKGNVRPILSDLRDSGSIEQDADVVLFVHRHHKYDPEHCSVNDAEIIIAKQKNGPCDTVHLHFDPECANFINEKETEW